MKNLIRLLLSLCVSTGLFWACTNNGNDPSNDFDRKAMLENFATNLIKPAYQDLQSKVIELQAAVNNFNENPTNERLTAMQTVWENAYFTWQFANAYNFGPAGEQGTQKGLIEEIGTFPISSSKIENAITNNNANFNDFNRDARGFLAIEYLIFDLNNDHTTIVNNFASQNRKNFLSNAVNNLKTRVDEVVSAWNITYTNDFTGNDGTDV